MTELNYQELVAGYYDNLNNNLRNFKGGPGFLETWVHDEDHNRSLLEILDLAHENAIEELSIQLTQDVIQTLNLDWLKRSASSFGSVELDGHSLNFSNAKGSVSFDEFAGLSECYLDPVKLASKAIAFEGTASGSELFKTSHSDGILSVAVNAEGLVTEAKHQGFKGAERAVMDRFCSVLVNRSLHEGFEHGAIRLEVLLRDPKKPVKVKGLLTADTADVIFHKPIQLVRELWHSYTKAKNIEPDKRNFWRDPVPQTWLDLAPEERMKRAQIAVTEACREYGLQVDVLVTEIKNNTRFVLSYKQAADKPDFGRHMIKMERWLRIKFGFEIELQLESLEDRNRREGRTNRT